MTCLQVAKVLTQVLSMTFEREGGAKVDMLPLGQTQDRKLGQLVERKKLPEGGTQHTHRHNTNNDDTQMIRLGTMTAATLSNATPQTQHRKCST